MTIRLNLSLYFLCEINRVVSKYCSWSTVCKMCFDSRIPFFRLAALLPAASVSLCIFLITLPQRWAGLHTIQKSCWSNMSISAWHLLCSGKWPGLVLPWISCFSILLPRIYSGPVPAVRERELWEQLSMTKSFHQSITYLRTYFGIGQDDLQRPLPTSANL